MNSPAAADCAYLYISFVMAWITVATGVTRLHARTAPSFLAGHLTSACPETSCVMGKLTAEMGGMNLRSFVVCLSHMHRLLPHVHHLSFGVEMGSASVSPGGVTTHKTALMAAMRTTVVSEMISE